MIKVASIGRIVLIAVVAGVAAGCNPFGPQACTLIGCSDGLTIELAGTPQGAFTITATALSGRTETISCAAGAACYPFFEDFTPSEVTVVYESGGTTVEETFSPEYTRSRPNGEDCPPECLQGTVRLDLA